MIRNNDQSGIRGLIAIAALAGLAAGCSARVAPSTRIAATGYVNLDRLVQFNPQWKRVARYDRLITSLSHDTGMVSPSRAGAYSSGGSPIAGATEAVLPAVAPPAATHTDLALQSEQARLEAVRNREVDE